MIIAGARRSPYSSKTLHYPTHMDKDSLFFPSNVLITETRMLPFKGKLLYFDAGTFSQTVRSGNGPDIEKLRFKTDT